MARLAHGAARDIMARHIFVVARGHHELYEFLRKQFIDDGNVSVVLDRRIADRRRAEPRVPGHGERRTTGDRRTRTMADEELRFRSHAIITIPE